MTEPIEVTLMQLYLFTFIIVGLGILFGCLISRSGYRDKYHKELMECKDALDKANAEKEKVIANRQRDISHAVTQEWNRGYNAAWEKLKTQFLFIQQWEKDHEMAPGEMEAIAQIFETEQHKED